MAQQTINVGTAPNDGTGTPLRTAFQYTNSNFTELYTATGPSGNNINVPGAATITGNLTVDTNTLFVDSANNCVGIGTTTPTVYANYKTLALVGGSSGFVIDAHATGGGTAGGMQIAATPTGTNFDVFGPNAGTAAPAVIRTGTFGSVSERYRIAGDGVATWSNVGGVAGTAMTLNSTGLGVGVTPIERLTVAGTASVGGTGNIGVKFHSGNPVTGNLAWLLSNDSANSNILNLYYYNAGVFSGRAFVVNQSGNFMVRTPSTPPTIPDNEMMVFNLTSNTNLRISVKGTDGTVRTADITLA